jgi:UDP-GlcNAc:undecaprenyl-phosphate GlcNAc-1-phosphate transferase
VHGAQLAIPLLVAFLVALAATLASEGVARRAGLVTQPREDRWHRRPVPLLGGVAMMVGVVAPFVLFGDGAVRSSLVIACSWGGRAADDVRPPARR